jgi:hypothetical protein
MLQARFDSPQSVIDWLRAQKGVISDHNNGALMIVRSSLRLQGALDAVENVPGVRVRRNVPGGRHRTTCAVIEGLGGLL